MFRGSDLPAQQAHCRDLLREAELDRRTYGALREAEPERRFEAMGGLLFESKRVMAAIGMAITLIILTIAAWLLAGGNPGTPLVVP